MLKGFIPSDDARYTGDLSNAIELCCKARVMVIRNIDVNDGLVNGSQGTVVEFVDGLRTEDSLLGSPLDNQNVGSKTRSSCEFSIIKYPNATPVLPLEVKSKTF